MVTLVVDSSFVNWRHFCLCGRIRQRHLWERPFKKWLINGFTYLQFNPVHCDAMNAGKCSLPTSQTRGYVIYTKGHIPQIVTSPTGSWLLPPLPPCNIWFLGPLWLPKWHLDRFSCFCRAYGCDQHIQTGWTHYICINRPHLMLRVVMWLNKKWLQ